MDSSGSPLKSLRRSQRILIQVNILIEGYRPDGVPFAEKTFTLVVNAHGALVRLHEPVVAGQKVTVTNVKARGKSDCEIVGIMPGRSGEPEVGLEFLEPSPRFWRVAFPPDDWSPHSPEAKRREKIPRSGPPASKAK